MAIIKFPANPSDGTLFEPAPGIVYRYNARERSWIRIDTTTVDLATPNAAGLMSKEDYQKLQSIILPPPQSTLQGEDCDIKFDGGVVSLYSTDESINIESSLAVGGQQTPWQLHENTAGYNFKLNLEQFVEQIESRGKLKKVQFAGPDGLKGKRGESGIDALDTGPEGAPGAPGLNSPFPGSFFPESTALEIDDDQKNRAIVDITTEQVSDSENYIVVTRANIGNPDACPTSLSPAAFDSPWILVLDQKEASITRRLEVTGDCAITCRICVSQVYYLNIENIIGTVEERYEAKLQELKNEKERIVAHWLKVMSSLFNEQKYALCCALENCTTRKRNQDVRRYLEQSRIQAAIGDQRLTVSSGDDDKVTVPSDQRCDLDEAVASDTDSRVVYGTECEQFLVTMSLDAKLHNRDPRSGVGGRWLTARLAPGDYMVEVLSCCANFGRKIQPRSETPRVPPAPPQAPAAPAVNAAQPTQYTPQTPVMSLPPKNMAQYVGQTGGSGGDSTNLFVNRPATTTKPAVPAQQPNNNTYNKNAGFLPVAAPFGSGVPGGAVPPGLRVPMSLTTSGLLTGPQIDAKKARGECVLELTNQVGNQPGDLLAKGYTGYIGADCRVAHGYANSVLVSGCKPICTDTNNAADPVVDNNLRFPNKYTGRVAILHYGLMPAQGTDEDRPVEKVTELPAVGNTGGFFQDLFAARQAYIGLSTIFNHAGGNIKVWIPDPDTISANNDGGIVIGIRSRKCVEDNASATGTTGSTTTQLPTIYVYRDILDPKTLVGSIQPFVTDLSHINNYGMSSGSGSATLTTGPVLEAEISKAFFVMASDGLGFYHIHHTNDPADAFSTSIFTKYRVESNAQTIDPIVEDDGGTIVSTVEPDAQVFTAAWTFTDETDGVVLNKFDPDVQDDWILTLDESNYGDIKKLIAVGVDGSELVLSQGSLGGRVPQQSVAEPFILCRALKRACNVPAALNKRYSIGIVNRVKGVNFRICRNIPEWSLDSWIRRPFVYAPMPYPCGSSFCNIKHQVIIGSDGQIVPFNNGDDHQARIDGSKVNIAFVIDQSSSMQHEYDYLSAKIDDLAQYILATDVNSLSMSLVTFGGQDSSGDPILRQDFTADIPTIVESIDMADPAVAYDGAYYQAAESPGLYAVQWTAGNVSWEPDAVKIIVVITDKDSGTTPGVTVETVTAALKAKKIILNGIVKTINESVGGSPRPFDTLLCESWSYRYAECDGSTNKHISEAWVIDKHSRSSCNHIAGESPARNGRGLAGVFGITASGKLWTDHGCRATFGIRYREDDNNAGILTTRYGRPNDPLNPAGGGVGLCYDNGGTLFSIDDLRQVNIEDDNLTTGATQLTDGNWDIQPFGRMRIGSGAAGWPNAPGGPMPFELTEAVVSGMASPNHCLIVGKFEAGFPPNNAPIQGALVNLRWSNLGDNVIASTITDSNGRYAFQVPTSIFPHNQTTFTAELMMYNLPFLGGTWTIDATKKNSSYNQIIAVNGANTSAISGDDITTIPTFEEKLYEFSGSSITHPEFPVTIGPDPSAPPGALDGAPSYMRYRFGVRGLYKPGSSASVNDGFTRVNDVAVVGGKLTVDLGFDDNLSDYDYDDIIIRMQHNGNVPCLPSDKITPILRASQSVVVNDLHSSLQFNNDGHLSGAGGSRTISVGVRALTNDEIATVKSALTCNTHGFLQQFANIKLREIQSFAPKIDADCGAAVFGGPSTIYNRVTGVPMTAATLDGTIQAVQATILGLPGTAIRASVYDKEGRGIVIRSIATNPTQTWEVRSWPIDDVDRYINYTANTFDTINQAASLGNDNQTTLSYTTTTTGVKLETLTVTSADTVRNLQIGDTRATSAAGRLNLYTNGLSIKLKDLATIGFEFINPDTGVICYFADVKVAVERVANATTGRTEVVMVDIANFEPFGTTTQEEGEIPLVVFGGVVESGGGTETQQEGSYATATMTLTDNPTPLDEILLGGTHREGNVIHGGSQVIWFVNEFIVDPHAAGYPGHQVMIGATPNDTLNNLCDFINGVGTQNGTWHNALVALGLPVTNWQENSFIECDGVSGDTITFKSVLIGIEGNSLQAREIIDQNSVIQFGSSATFSGGVNPIDGPVLVTTLEMTEDDMSAYLENFWSIALPDTVDNPNICTRFKELCPDCVVVKCDRTDQNSVLRQEIECIDKASDMLVPLTKYLFTPIAPCETCMMYYKQVEWYERGWRIGACCGAFLEIDGQQWIVVKRSIGIDTTCGGGESENTECIRQFIESGRGHPAIAWPSVDGEEFIGRPHSGFAKFTLDPGLSDQIIEAISNHQYRALRGNLTPGNVAETIPFILFPRLG